MTKQEAVDYLNNIVPEQVHMVTLDATLWDDFKTSMLAILNDPGIDPKYKKALEDIDAIITSTL